MGLGKRDLTRKNKSIELKIEELKQKIHKNPMNKQLQEELKEVEKKLQKVK
jgi:hypothetical protein